MSNIACFGEPVYSYSCKQGIRYDFLAPCEVVKVLIDRDVARLAVFGSVACSTNFDPDTSDANFLVELNPDSDLPSLEQFYGLVDAQREALGRLVELVENQEFRNPYLRTSINESREVVYAS